MKNLALMSLITVLATPQTWASLPKPCEELAWKFASQQCDPEDYAKIINVTETGKGLYTATVIPTETAVYTMTFRYNELSNKCLILFLEASYR